MKPLRTIALIDCQSFYASVEKFNDMPVAICDKKINILKVMDNIKDRYGDDAIMRASSLTEAGQARERAKMIGGHYK